MAKSVEQYIKSLENVLAPHFGPDCLYHGERGALRLAREVGVGLADFPQEEVNNIVQSLYSRLVVRFTLTSRSGVPLDAKPWFDELRKADAEERQKRALRALARAQQ